MTDRAYLPVWMVGVGLAVAFGAGYLAGDLRSAQPSSGATASVEQLGRVGTVSAPPLTQEQLQGTLPAGHPGFASTEPGAGTSPGADTRPGPTTQPGGTTQPAPVRTTQPGVTSAP